MMRMPAPGATAATGALVAAFEVGLKRAIVRDDDGMG